MIRLSDWPERLAAHVAAARERPFVWGAHDCCTFACDAVLAMTGIDPMAPLRGRYADALSAARRLKAYGGDGLPEAAERLAAEAGFAPLAPAFAQRGDGLLAEVITPGGVRAWALGIVGPDGIGRFAAPLGLTAIEPRAAARAWKV